jgi:hypothetical protein
MEAPHRHTLSQAHNPIAYGDGSEASNCRCESYFGDSEWLDRSMRIVNRFRIRRSDLPGHACSMAPGMLHVAGYSTWRELEVWSWRAPQEAYG